MIRRSSVALLLIAPEDSVTLLAVSVTVLP